MMVPLARLSHRIYFENCGLAQTGALGLASALPRRPALIADAIPALMVRRHGIKAS